MLHCLVHQVRNVLVERAYEDPPNRQEVVYADVFVHLHPVVRQEADRSRLVEGRAHLAVDALIQYVQLVDQVLEIRLLYVELEVLSSILEQRVRDTHPFVL